MDIRRIQANERIKLVAQTFFNLASALLAAAAARIYLADGFEFAPLTWIAISGIGFLVGYGALGLLAEEDI